MLPVSVSELRTTMSFRSMDEATEPLEKATVILSTFAVTSLSSATWSAPDVISHCFDWPTFSDVGESTAGRLWTVTSAKAGLNGGTGNRYADGYARPD